MVNDVVAPARRRGGRRLVVVGGVVVAVALVAGLTCAGMVARSVGAPFSEAFTNASRPTPVDEQVTLREGRYTVFELVGRQTSQGPVTTWRRDAPTVTADMVRVTGPDRATVAADDITSGSETLNRGQDIYAGVARFDVPGPGPYRVQVDAPAGREVVIAPSFGSGFGAARNWVLAGIGCFLALVAGVVLVLVGATRRRPAPAAAATGAAGAAAPVPVAGPPPGWYRAPDQPGRERYWDGRAWTGHVR
jgi:hypothetical protein